MTQSSRLLAVWIAAALLVGGVGLAIRAGDNGRDKGTDASGQRAGVPRGDGSVSPGALSTPTTGVAAGGSGSNDSGPSVPAPPAVDAPAPGSYVTTAAGSITVNGGETFPADGPSEFVVETVDSGSPGDQRVTLPLGPGVLSSVLHYKPDGIDLVSADLILGAAATFEPPEPVVHVPADPQEGQSWNWHMTSTNGATNGMFTTTASGPAVVDVAGQAIPVVVLESVIQFDEQSDLQGVIHLTTWFSRELRLPIQTHVVLDVNYGGGYISLTSDVTQTLSTLTPS